MDVVKVGLESRERNDKNCQDKRLSERKIQFTLLENESDAKRSKEAKRKDLCSLVIEIA